MHFSSQIQQEKNPVLLYHYPQLQYRVPSYRPIIHRFSQEKNSILPSHYRGLKKKQNPSRLFSKKTTTVYLEAGVGGPNSVAGLQCRGGGGQQGILSAKVVLLLVLMVLETQHWCLKKDPPSTLSEKNTRKKLNILQSSNASIIKLCRD